MDSAMDEINRLMKELSTLKPEADSSQVKVDEAMKEALEALVPETPAATVPERAPSGVEAPVMIAAVQLLESGETPLGEAINSEPESMEDNLVQLKEEFPTQESRSDAQHFPLLTLGVRGGMRFKFKLEDTGAEVLLKWDGAWLSIEASNGTEFKFPLLDSGSESEVA